MRVRVELYGHLQAYAKDGDKCLDVEIEESATVGELITQLGVPKGTTWNAAMDGKLVYNNDLLCEGAFLMLFPPSREVKNCHKRSKPDMKLHRLPVFDNHYGRPEHWSGLQVDGLVAEPRTFSTADLETLAATILRDDFRCEEGWTVADQKWEGVSLDDMLHVVRPLPDARYAEVSASDYSVVIPLTGAKHALLAIKLNDDILPEEHGAPCRLVLRGAACYTSIKWVDHIRLTAKRGTETAQRIASQRNRASNPDDHVL